MAITTLPRDHIRAAHRADENTLCQTLADTWGPDAALRTAASDRAARLIEDIRTQAKAGLMESFLSEYGLSTDEGVALMCLAEALLRVPDTETIDAIIEDKIAPSKWDDHLGQSTSSLINATTWALMITGKVIDARTETPVAGTLHRMVKRLGEPVIRAAVLKSMKFLGQQFVLGETMEDAIKRGRSKEAAGFTYSYDMLGEAAMTARDADDFYDSYMHAIAVIGKHATKDTIEENPGISIKLSALHPRYDYLQRDRMADELLPRIVALVTAAKEAGIGLNIDAEEAARLEISLDLIEQIMANPVLDGWDGFGIVVQAYSKRASATIDWLYDLASLHDRNIMIRLVKGAYWDTEIKQAQIDGVTDFPVFTRKALTDVSYMCCARQLLSKTDRIYPQFATHNAHSAAAILEMAADKADSFEFQCLHGMGAELHNLLRTREGMRSRIYAPVGSHKELLAYLVRRLLENGANSSFVNQLLDGDVPPETLATDPFLALDSHPNRSASVIKKPADMFGPSRRNSAGWDLRDPVDLADFDAARAPYQDTRWHAAPLLAVPHSGTTETAVTNPANPGHAVGKYVEAAAKDAVAAADGAEPWTDTPERRADILRRAADLYEAHRGEIFALLASEAGKTAGDAIAELREAVDFLRFYADEGIRLGGADARGVVTCISPWNFPLAIFTGQIAAALAAGNAVLAKPAETTSLIAWFAVGLLHKAGVPVSALQLLPGAGGEIGQALTAHPDIQGVCFTGSTATAQRINRVMADTVSPSACLVAETGGLNAMIVDSTALPEQAVRDIVESAFASAGQRCSALRMLYVQKDCADTILDMLYGAMQELRIGDPWNPATDVGPVISDIARTDIQDYVDAAARQGRLLRQLEAPKDGHFVGPAVISVSGIGDLTHEVFGPVLHVATFEARDLDSVVDAINASGFGLTFGLHSRIDDRVQTLTSKICVGNVYVNRNQIGAIVQSQPFGGEGMSGTGPKAGGPHYVAQFKRPATLHHGAASDASSIDLQAAQALIDKAVRAQADSKAAGPLETTDMPGPTGESNRLSTFARGVILCLGPTAEAAGQQAAQARAMGCTAVQIAPGASGVFAADGRLDYAALASLDGLAAAALWSKPDDQRRARKTLAGRDGALIPLFTEADFKQRCVLERHICIDTTAAGGNTSLMVAVDAADAA